MALALVGQTTGRPSAIHVVVNRVVTCSDLHLLTEAFGVFYATHFLWGVEFLEDSSYTMDFFMR